MSSLYGRAGILRKAFNYQDLIALDAIVDFLEHEKRYEWIYIEADDAGSIDDIVIKKTDGTCIFKQVKFSGYPLKDTDHLDMKKLVTPAKKNAKSNLKKWYESLIKIEKNYDSFEASLETNRQMARSLDLLVSSSGFLEYDKIDPKDKSKILSQIPDEKEAKWFFSKFRFKTNLKDYKPLRCSIIRRIDSFEITDKGRLNLFDQFNQWITQKNRPAPDGKITIDVIRKACLWKTLEGISQQFPLPSDFVIPSELFHTQFMNKIITNESPIVLKGKAGTGKSSYLSFVYNELKKRDIPVIRNHYFLSTRDKTPDRFNHHIVKESLMSDLKADYPDITIYSKNISSNEFTDWIRAVGKFFSEQQKNLVIIIDGLDHVWRETQSKEEIDKLLNYLLPVRDGITVVFGSQPLNDQVIPSSLLRYCPQNQWINLPLLDLDATKKWIRKHEDLIVLPKQDTKEYVLDNIAEKIYQLSNGHPLYLYYLIKDIKEKDIRLNYKVLDNIELYLSDDINSYYIEQTNKLSSESIYVLSLYTISPFSLSEKYTIECLSSVINEVNIYGAIQNIQNLLEKEENGYRVHHDSLRNYLLNAPKYEYFISRVKQLLLGWLINKAPSYLKWSHYWIFSSELGDNSPLFSNLDREWVINSLNSCYPINDIIRIINWGIKQTITKKELYLAIKFGYLRDYLFYIRDFKDEIMDNIFFAYIRSNLMDDYLYNNYIEKICDLSDSQIIDLTQHSNIDKVKIDALFEELFERQKGNRVKRKYESPDSNSSIKKFLEIAPIKEDIELQRFVDYFLEISDVGTQLLFFNKFCKSGFIIKKSDLFVSLMELKLPEKLMRIVIKYSVLLSFEEKFKINEHISGLISHPFLILNKFVINEKYKTSQIIEPDIEILNLKSRERYSRKTEIKFGYYEIFYYFLANRLLGTQANNSELITKISNYWIEASLIILEQVSEYVSQNIKKQELIDVSSLFIKFNSLKKPNWGSNRENMDLSECLENVIHDISFDLMYINAALKQSTSISEKQLKNMFNSTYFNLWHWLQELAKLNKSWLEADALSWLNREYKNEIKIEPFSEKAMRYSILSKVFSTHHQTRNAETYINLTNKHLVAYGDHKDVNLFHVFKVVEMAYENSVPKARDWLLQLITPVLYVEDFTDGDETMYLRNELSKILAKYERKWFEKYYSFNLINEKYRYIDYHFSYLVNNIDLGDEFDHIVAESIINKPGIESILKLKEAGNPDALALSQKIAKFQGDSIFEVIKDKQDSSSIGKKVSFAKSTPNIEKYPPEQFIEFISSFDYSFDKRLELKKWMSYWIKQGASKEILNQLELAHYRGISFMDYDLVFNLALQVKGRKKAFKWLIIAQNESGSWLSRWESDEKRLARWKKVKDVYPNMWFDFLRKSLLDYKIGDYELLSVSMVEYLIKYCYYFGDPSLALQLTEQIIKSMLELVQAPDLPALKWVNDLE